MLFSLFLTSVSIVTFISLFVVANLAYLRTTNQSSVDSQFTSKLAVDGEALTCSLTQQVCFLEPYQCLCRFEIFCLIYAYGGYSCVCSRRVIAVVVVTVAVVLDVAAAFAAAINIEVVDGHLLLLLLLFLLLLRLLAPFLLRLLHKIFILVFYHIVHFAVYSTSLTIAYIEF